MRGMTRAEEKSINVTLVKGERDSSKSFEKEGGWGWKKLKGAALP